MKRVQVQSEGIILEKTDRFFEDHSVLNPACVQKGNIVHVFYRAVQQDLKSTIGYCQLSDNKVIFRADRPVLSPECEYERQGLEDPRIVQIDNIYYLTYTAFDNKTAAMAYAVSTELPHFTKRGLLFPKILFKEVKHLLGDSECGRTYLAFKQQYLETVLFDNDPVWLKNLVFFPRKINGKFALLYRILPGMHITFCDDLHELTIDYWKDNLRNLEDHVMFYPKFNFETHHVAAGCPPIETEDGWLMIYHSVEKKEKGLTYHACAALLDLNNPQKILSRLDYPLFSPREGWETLGVVNNVVFPSGTAIYGDRLFIYYGAADNMIAAKSVSIAELLAALKSRI
ncbi:MAG: pesticidal protein Cry7Aa [Gammaproteobacteria bacterium]